MCRPATRRSGSSGSQGSRGFTGALVYRRGPKGKLSPFASRLDTPFRLAFEPLLKIWPKRRRGASPPQGAASTSRAVQCVVMPHDGVDPRGPKDLGPHWGSCLQKCLAVMVRWKPSMVTVGGQNLANHTAENVSTRRAPLAESQRELTGIHAPIGPKHREGRGGIQDPGSGRGGGGGVVALCRTCGAAGRGGSQPLVVPCGPSCLRASCECGAAQIGKTCSWNAPWDVGMGWSKEFVQRHAKPTQSPRPIGSCSPETGGG